MKTLTAAQDLGMEGPPVGLLTTSSPLRSWGRRRVLGMGLWLYLPVCILSAWLLLPSTQASFAAWGLRWVHILGLAFGLSFSLTPLSAALAQRFNILDVPDRRKLHGRATPLLGGAALVVGFTVSLLANAMLTPQLAAILGATLVLFTVGVIDDRREVRAGVKLLIQVGCTMLVMAAGVVLQVLPMDWGGCIPGRKHPAHGPVDRRHHQRHKLL